MKIFFSCLIVGLVTLIFGFGIGQQVGKQDSQKQIKELQTSLGVCENMWKLDKELFYPELCETVCIEKIKKMSC